jgi:hypothetical protein
MRHILLFTFLICGLSSCTTKETIYVNEQEQVVIDGNEAPPYSEITTVQIQSYVNKLYIDLLGREPDLAELEGRSATLKAAGLTTEARSTLVSDLINQPAYYARFWEIYRRAYLNGVSDNLIQQQRGAFQFAYDDLSQNTDPNSIAYASFILLELEKIDLLLSANEDYENGTIAINEFMARIAFNNICDEINMGAENMVLACFENFLKRQPTIAELTAGVEMVDANQSAQLLLQDGNDKNDFVNIITSNPEFYQGLVFDIYQQLLVREPTSTEMVNATENLLQNKNYQAIQQTLTTTDEYAGFQ